MRFVSTYCLREGMVLSKSIHNANGTALLKKDIKLTKRYIQKIEELGLIGVYIDDRLSRDIKVEDVINEELRLEATRGVQTIFNSVASSKGDPMDMTKEVSSASKIVDNIINNLLKSQYLMVNMVDIKIFDERTFAHSVNVAVLSLIMGVSMKMSDKELYELGVGALLHDIGKAFIPPEILNKPGKLTEKEMEIMKTHATIGYEHMRDNSSIPEKSQLAILEHHERFDGSGYPIGKADQEISKFAKIIAICDVYDALTSKRAYKEAQLPSETIEYIMGSADTLFDIDLVRVFCSKVAIYPSGTIVKLSDGRDCIVVDNHPGLPTRPTVKSIKSEDIIDLTVNENLNVTIIGTEELNRIEHMIKKEVA